MCQAVVVHEAGEFLSAEASLVYKLAPCHSGVTPEATSGGLEVQGKPRLSSETLLEKQKYESLSNLLCILILSDHLNRAPSVLVN